VTESTPNDRAGAVIGAPGVDPRASQIPLCVDLDGTLLLVNSLYEAVAALVRTNPLYLVLIPVWLMRGKAALWHEVAGRVRPNPEWLPYRLSLVSWLREQSKQRRVILVTGADQRFATEVAAHFDLFDSVLGSAGGTHLTGDNKAAALTRIFGVGGYDYVGDSRHDLPVWNTSRQAYCVAAGEGVRSAVRRLKPDVEFVEEDAPRSRFYVLFRLLRVHQWAKNILVFAPVITSHRVFNGLVMFAALRCFAAFCCCASAAYILNDLTDLEADRRHASKRRRPLAAGLISIPLACAAVAVLLAGAVGFAATLPIAGAAVVALYFLTTVLYSAGLKGIAVLDIFVLAGLYAVRVLGGGAATGISVSAWTAGFFMFLFISLALLKRFTELARLPGLTTSDKIPGRGYSRSDIDFVSQAGIASGLVSILVLALYINSPEVHALYKRPQILWLMCPVLGWGILSMWLTGHRGGMHDDPVVFAIKSPLTWLLGAIGAALLVAASL
jgi:4-hydroxybenzoate polyprenyltransferase/phosphoserine phosphatase